ncbi:MAG: transporter [Coxiellaceae bacterium]|nr:MAG: transporter [Coxiellaceae bacterium]
MRLSNKKLFLLLVSLFTISNMILADTAPYCSDTESILTFLNRPSVADNACTVPNGKASIEAGYAYSNLIGGGSGHDFPETFLRLGLPKNNEIVIGLPNYYLQSITPHSGFGTTNIGLKHEIGTIKNFFVSIEGIVAPPSGSRSFGNDDIEGTFNTLIGYNFSPTIIMTIMLGASSYTMPSSFGGQRYNTVNPDVVFTWQVSRRIQYYSEIYGQSQTQPGDGAGFNFDGGILYAIKPRFEVDAEVGRRISGSLGGFNNYFGVGFGLLLG